MFGSILGAVEPARDALLDRLPDPSRLRPVPVQDAGRQATAAVDRARGRPRRPGLAWLVGAALLVGLGLVALTLAMSWARTRGLTSQADAIQGLDRMSEPDLDAGPDLGAADLPSFRAPATGLTAAQDSLLTYDPLEGRDA